MRHKKVCVKKICEHVIIKNILNDRGFPDYADWRCRVARCKYKKDLTVFCVIRDAILEQEGPDSQNRVFGEKSQEGSR